MKVEATSLPGVIIVSPKRWSDHRGYFVEVFNQKTLSDFGIDMSVVQENQSFSTTAGTVRGLHFQTPPHPQAKLIRVLSGRIFDVAIDIRAGSPTYRKWVAVELTALGGEQLFIPAGFAHGFCTLEPNTEVSYLVDAVYTPQCDRAILWNDPDLGIAWPDIAGALVSEKDEQAPRLAAIPPPFL